MKYKKQLATGALALSLFLSGSTIYAANPQELGIGNVSKTFQKQNKDKRKDGIRIKKQNGIVGTVSAITSTGFTVNLTNMKTGIVSSVDVSTNALTTYRKDGLEATARDVMVGEKVIVSGTLDKVTNIVTAKNVKIVTKAISPKAKIRKEVKSAKEEASESTSTESAENTTTKTN